MLIIKGRSRGDGTASPVTLTAEGAGTGAADYASSLLYLPFNGENGASIITDLSPYQRKDVTNSGVITSTTQSKFNGSSARYDGSSYIRYKSEKLILPTVFTIRGWVRFDALSGLQILFDTRIGNSSGFPFLASDSSLQAYGIIASASGKLSTGQWHLCQFCRAADNSVYLFIDGELEASGSSAGVFDSGQVVMGRTNESAANYVTGYMSHWQLLTGVCANTETYTPPSSPFLLAGQITGTITANTSGVIDFIAIATDAETGDVAGVAYTSTNNFTIDCNTTAKCVVTLLPANAAEHGLMSPVSILATPS